MIMNKWILVFGWLALVPLFGAAQPAERACFSVPGGFYPESFELEIFPFYAQHHIRYTTNGNRPTAQSKLYTGPLTLDERLYSTSDIFTIPVAPEGQMYYPDSVKHCIVIRAAVFDENENRISEVATNSYFIKSLGCDTHWLPVVSLCADSLDLFGYYRGIMVPGAWFNPNLPDWSGNYFCKGMEWERPCNVEYYEQYDEGINQQAGLRTHGGASRRQQQKGFKIFAREEYGKKRFEPFYYLSTNLTSFKHLSLKPYRSSNWMTTGIQDPLAQYAATSFLNVDGLALRETVLFLNGEYYGIYLLEEVPDERYLEDHYDVSLEDVNIIKKWNQLDCGDTTNWFELYRWVKETDLSIPENYQKMESLIDMDNFIDYIILELYSSNVDWPANNVRCWQEGNGRWRWFFYDGDGCFFKDWDVFANVTDTSNAVNPSNAKSTLFFRKLSQNYNFVQRFSDRFRYLMYGTLCYLPLGSELRCLQGLIRDEVPNQVDRFNFPSSMEVWERDFAHVDEHLRGLNDLMEQKLTQFLANSCYMESEKTLLCYPNPFHKTLTLRLDQGFGDERELRVYDVLGQEVYHERLPFGSSGNLVSIELNLPAGIYFVKVDDRVAKLICQ